MDPGFWGNIPEGFPDPFESNEKSIEKNDDNQLLFRSYDFNELDQMLHHNIEEPLRNESKASSYSSSSIDEEFFHESYQILNELQTVSESQTFSDSSQTSLTNQLISYSNLLPKVQQPSDTTTENSTDFQKALSNELSNLPNLSPDLNEILDLSYEDSTDSQSHLPFGFSSNLPNLSLKLDEQSNLMFERSLDSQKHLTDKLSDLPIVIPKLENPSDFMYESSSGFQNHSKNESCNLSHLLIPELNSFQKFGSQNYCQESNTFNSEIQNENLKIVQQKYQDVNIPFSTSHMPIDSPIDFQISKSQDDAEIDEQNKSLGIGDLRMKFKREKNKEASRKYRARKQKDCLKISKQLKYQKEVNKNLKNRFKELEIMVKHTKILFKNLVEFKLKNCRLEFRKQLKLFVCFYNEALAKKDASVPMKLCEDVNGMFKDLMQKHLSMDEQNEILKWLCKEFDDSNMR